MLLDLYAVPEPLRPITPDGWESLPEDLAHNFRVLAGAGGGAGGGAWLAWFLGSGRMVDADLTAGRILPPETPANSFRIPNARYLIEMAEVVVAEPQGYAVGRDVPEVAGTYHVWAVAASGGGVEVDEYASAYLYEPGRAYLGTITTDGTAVTAVDGGYSHIVQPFAALNRRLLVGTGGGGGGGGGGTGAVDLLSIMERLSELNERLLAIEENKGGGPIAVPTRSENLHVDFLALIGYLGDYFPGLHNVVRPAFDVPGITGDREPRADGPARRTFAGGDAERDAATHSVG